MVHCFLSPPHPWRQPREALNKHPGGPWDIKYSPRVRETSKLAHLSHQRPSSLNDKMCPKSSGLLLPAALLYNQQEAWNYESWATKKNSKNSSTSGRSESNKIGSSRVPELGFCRWEIEGPKSAGEPVLRLRGSSVALGSGSVPQCPLWSCSLPEKNQNWAHSISSTPV